MEKDGKSILQIETKASYANLWHGVGEAMYYNMENEIPTFLAIPIDLRGGTKRKAKAWDGWEEATKIYKHYKINIGVLMVAEDNNVEIKHDPRNFFHS